jgi:hypothetical protein
MFLFISIQIATSVFLHLGLVEMAKDNSIPSWLESFAFSNFVWLLYFPPVFFLLILITGRYALSGILYPYQNYFIKDTLDRQTNLRFGGEMQHSIACFVHTLKAQSGVNSILNDPS